MNQFWQHEDIFGRVETAHLNRVMEDFLELVSEIRHKLDRQAYLLDQYISTILEAARNPLLYTAAQQGDAAADEYVRLCQSVMDGENDFKEHPMYETVKEYIGTHPLTHQESTTRLNLYCIALSGNFLTYAAKEYYRQQKTKQGDLFDIVVLRDLFRSVSAIIGGEEDMERLNLLIRQRFLIITPMAGFQQGLTDDLLRCLTSRDVETGRLALQLWLDGPAPMAEEITW